MDTRPKQGLVGIDVAHPRPHPLVEQYGLDGRLSAGQNPVEPATGEVPGQGLRPQGRQHPVRIAHQPEPPELAGIQVAKLLSALQTQYYMGMPVHLPVRGHHAQGAGHAQVHHQRPAGIQAQQHVLGPSLQILEPPAPDQVAETVRVGFRNGACPGDFRAFDAPAFQQGPQLHDVGFDFGQFGHLGRTSLGLGSGATIGHSNSTPCIQN